MLRYTVKTRRLLCNLVWNTYDDIVLACAKAWKFMVDDPERIQSIGKRDWASVNG